MINKVKRKNLSNKIRNAYITNKLFKGKEDDYDITTAKADYIKNSDIAGIDNENSVSTLIDQSGANNKNNNYNNDNNTITNNNTTTNISNTITNTTNNNNNNSNNNNNNNDTPSVPYENFLSGKWVIPKAIVEKIIHASCDEHDEQQKRQFIIDVAKYWCLKRESRGGASLLKRLHIEPWSAYSTSYIENKEGNKKLKTLEVLATIRSNLEKMKTLIKMVVVRERRKLLLTKIQKRIIETIHFPISAFIRPIFYDIRRNDKDQVFWYPVNAEEVEDYYDIIKHPMSFDIIEKKIDTYQYKNVQEFKVNIFLKSLLI